MNETLLEEGRPGGKPPVSVDQKRRFLRALAIEHRVDRACLAAGIARATAYRIRAADPEFARTWDLALEALPARVQDAAIEEGLEGRPVLDDQGRPVLDADGNPVRARNIPVLRDLMRKYMGIPSGNSVNVGVQLSSASAPVDLDDLVEQVLPRLRSRPEPPIDAEFEPVGVEDLV